MFETNSVDSKWSDTHKFNIVESWKVELKERFQLEHVMASMSNFNLYTRVV